MAALAAFIHLFSEPTIPPLQACAALGEYEEGLEIMEGMAEEGQVPPGSPTNARVLLQTHITRLSTAIAERDSEQAK